MTEYELFDVMVSHQSAYAGELTIFLSLLSGYLLVAYLVAAKLTKVQVTVVSVLFTLASVQTIMAMAERLGEIQKFADAINQLGGMGAEVQPAGLNLAFVLYEVFGVIAALYFMWNRREVKAN